MVAISLAHAPSATRRRVAMAAVTIGTVVSAFEGTVVTSAMPAVARELGGSASYGWVFSSFLITSTLTMLVCGKLADAFGRRPVFLCGMAIFLIGSALCGASTSFGMLIGFRALQGLGAGALQPLSMTIGADLYPLKERARVQAFSTAVWGLANVIGPVLGGWIVEHASWRWVFLVNVPVGIVAAALLVVAYRDPRPVRTDPVGVGGALLAGSATGLVTFALAPQGVHSATGHVVVAAAAAAAVSALIRFQIHSKAPLIARSALAEPAVRAGLAAGACLGGLLYALSAYVPLWIIAQGRGDGIAAGATLVPLLAGWALGSGLNARLLVSQSMRQVTVRGFAIALFGAASLALVVAGQEPTAWAWACLAVLGVGMGSVATASVLVPQSCVAWGVRGSVTSAIFASRMLGGSIGVAALGAAGVGGHDVARFCGIATLPLAGLLLCAALAPRSAAAERIAGPLSAADVRLSNSR